MCWQHAGTYLGDLGLVLGSHHIRFTAGSVERGMSLHVDGQLIKQQARSPVITLDSNVRVNASDAERCTLVIESKLSTTIACRTITIRVINADK